MRRKRHGARTTHPAGGYLVPNLIPRIHMQYRPGRPSDLTALRGLLAEASVAEQSPLAARTAEALRTGAATVYVAHDRTADQLRGILLLDTAGSMPVRTDLLLPPAGWERETGGYLLDAAVSNATVVRGLQAAVPASASAAIAFFERHNFVNTGEGVPGEAEGLILFLREGRSQPVAQKESPEDDFPTAADEPPAPDFDPVYAELPDLQLAAEELPTDLPIDRENSSLSDQQIDEVADFIERARQLKTERATSGYTSRHPEVELEVDFGEPSPPDPVSQGPGFEFAFDENPDEDALELDDIPESEPEVTPAELRAELEDRLGERLSAYFGAAALPEYLQRYHRAENFHRIRDANLQQLSAWINARPPGAEAGRRKRRALGELIEYFIVESAADLHGNHFPQHVLRYQGAEWDRTDLYRLVMDYLNFREGAERVYTDFVTIPPKVLKRASEGYLRTGPDERLFFICDQGILGAGKQGFAMTDAGIYWKNVMQPAGAATYTTLREVSRKQDHLLIDGQYFDAGEPLNLRVALLLDKLRRLEPPK